MSRAFKTGPIRKYGDLEFYAIDGLVALHDLADGFHTLMTPATFAERATAVKNMITANAANTSEMDFNFKATKGVEAMEKCVLEAKAMGDPTDPRVIAWYRKHNTRGGRT